MLLLSQVVLAASMTVAQPDPGNIKAVFDHFYAGQGKGAIVYDVVLCKTIEMKKKDIQFDCIEPFGGDVAKDQSVNVYVSALVPKGDTAELAIQAIHEGQVRETKDMSLKGDFIRSRKWVTFGVKKPGKWEFKVMEKDKVLKSVSITST